MNRMNGMLTNEKYDRNELITRLQEMGVNPKLLKMPAVIERILSDYPKLNTIEVDINGNILYDSNREKFELQQDGTVKTKYRNGLIDAYGMEVIVYEEDRLDRLERRDNKIFENETDCTFSYGWKYIHSNYPGWQLLKVKEAKEEQYMMIIGHTILEYPETENWFVENGFLSQEKETRNNEIVQAVQKAQEELERKLQYERGLLQREEMQQRDPSFDAMDATSGGALETIFSIGRPSQEERIKLIKRNIELLEGSIEKCSNYIEVYSNGERPVEDTEYTEEQAESNRLEYFSQQTEKYTTEAQEIEGKNDSRAEKLPKLQELARRCARIPFVGRHVASVLSEQMKLLQEGNEDTETEKSEIANERLAEIYEAYIVAFSRYKKAQKESEKYSEIFRNLKECIVECGKIPFVGKRILREMDEITIEKSNEEEQNTEER